MNMKLWDKGQEVDKAIERFTVGNDYLLDQKLIPFDCVSSRAHARMLCKIGILSKKEFSQLDEGLNEILKLHKEGSFLISPKEEDCHTAIENFLTNRYGNTGKKIHTGRSRNDQVLTALRLYEKSELVHLQGLLDSLQKSIAFSMEKFGAIGLPGYTHMQKAMPTTIRMWFAAYAESLKDDQKLLEHVMRTIDKSPLGSGAGFGIPILPIHRPMTAKELGFSSTMETMYCQNSRGKYESLVCDALLQVMLTLNKIATDFMLFSMPEFGYFSLAQGLCTGSSIMPQKKNPDVLELLRAKYGIVAGYSTQIRMVSAGLISGYHRDLQLTKEPLINSIEITKDCLQISTLLFEKLAVNKAHCERALSSEVYATEEAYKLVRKGMPFRDAYKKIGQKYSK